MKGTIKKSFLSQDKVFHVEQVVVCFFWQKKILSLYTAVFNTPPVKK